MATEKYTLKGYSIKTWAIKNKDNIKLLISTIVGLIIASVSNAQVGVILGIASKLGLDMLDYYLKD